MYIYYPFGNEDLSYISERDYIKILGSGFMSVPKLVENVHFDENRPENHNIYISNIRDNCIMIYDGKQWKLQDRCTIMNQLMDDKVTYLIDKFEQLGEKLSTNTIKKFQKFIDSYEDTEITDFVKKELKFILYNNKSIIENTKQIIDRKILSIQN